MLVEELKQVLETVDADYSGLGVVQVIQETIQALQARAPNQMPQFHAMISAVRKKIATIETGYSPLLDSARVRELFRNTTFKGLLPSEIAHNLNIIAQTDPNAAGYSVEAQHLLDRVTNAQPRFAQFCSVADEFHQETLTSQAGQVILILRYAPQNFWDLGSVGDQTKKYDDFVKFSIEYFTSSRDFPRLTHFSMGDPIAFIEASGAIAVTLIHVWKEFIEFAKAYVNLRKIVNSLRAYRENDETTEKTINYVQAKLEDSITERIKSLCEIVGKNEDDHRRNEVTASYMTSSKFVIKQIENGAQLNIQHRGSVTLVAMAGGESDDKKEERQKLIEELSTAQEELISIRSQISPILLSK